MNNFLEKDIEDYLCDEEQEIELNNGVTVSIINRQVNVNDEFIDCIGIGDDNNIYVIEIKRDAIDGKALAQLYNYIDYVREYQKHSKIKRNVKGILIGTSIDYHMTSTLKYLEDIFYIETKMRFSFKERQYEYTEEYLKSERYKKSYQKFNELLDGYECFEKDEIGEEDGGK